MIDRRSNASAAEASDLIVFDSSTTWDRPWLSFQLIAQHLSRRAPVLFVDSPESPVTAYRHRRRMRFRSELQQVGQDLYRLTPAAPPGLTRVGVERLTRIVVRRAVRKAVRALGDDVHCVLSTLSHVNIFPAIDADHRVYYVSDDFRAGASLMGRSEGKLAALDAELAEQADSIVAISPALSEAYKQRGFAPVLIPNGVEVDAFRDVDNAPLPKDVDLPGPIVGFVGQIGNRIDIRILSALVDTGLSVLLVGERQRTFTGDAELATLLARPNVCWVGPKAFTDLPRYLRVMDVGIVPYCDTDFNRASFPLKALEYLAAGRPVVSTPLPAMQWLDTDLISLASTPEAFAAATLAASALPRTDADVDERRAFAEKHAWRFRVAELAEVMGVESPPTV